MYNVAFIHSLLDNQRNDTIIPDTELRTLYVIGFAKTHQLHTPWQRTVFIING